MIERATLKPHESLSIHAEKLLTEPFMQHLCYHHMVGVQLFTCQTASTRANFFVLHFFYIFHFLLFFTSNSGTSPRRNQTGKSPMLRRTFGARPCATGNGMSTKSCLRAIWQEPIVSAAREKLVLSWTSFGL